MGEIIYTEFSINEKVLWERNEKGVQKSSVHTIREIKTSTRYIYRSKVANTIVNTLKAHYYSFMAMITPQSKMLEKRYGLKAQELFADIELGKGVEKDKVVTIVHYYMKDLSKPITNDQLKSVVNQEEYRYV
tara:strand:+ start:1839 stop:2234 length:396 start_codon:yes stop_codon:yes gene_type:complete